MGHLRKRPQNMTAVQKMQVIFLHGYYEVKLSSEPFCPQAGSLQPVTPHQ